MKYSIEWLKRTLEEGKRFKYLYFWGHQSSKKEITASCFSQWWVAPFSVDNVIYKTAEHWMMAQKANLFGDNDAFEKIVKARTPGEAKAIGRKVKNFDDSVWEEKRFKIVVNGSLQKFGQHQDLQEFLINTKDRILVEASPVDNIWGIGLAADDKKSENPENWEGLNLLGFALMETRDILNNN
ncbi:NADAR family protein [Adhaeribacter radiodurans]|uniref:NADAR family protein n=1 Tax=Adhaeribacter radiodurans TaxID=2745197 RepID=A0A7L7LAV3_9BACT|nr:NADAR family protein [Adhaeribacter radiodurans]QMU29867.1 NADAR family protein [Adhaeribacter radiodurans]